MRSFILLLCLIPTIICAQNLSLENQLKQAIQGKKAEIGIAVIIDGKDTVTVNNDIHYPLMSVFKFHQALALADYMGKQQQSLNFELTIKKEDLKPDTYIMKGMRYSLGRALTMRCISFRSYPFSTESVSMPYSRWFRKNWVSVWST